MRKLRTVYFVILFAMLAAASSAFAATPGPDSAAAPAKPISITGLVDMYYSYNFADPASRTNSFARNFDVNANQFSLSLAKISLSKAAEPIGFKIDLAYGRTADMVHAGPFPTGADETYKNIEQAYLTTLLPIGKGLTVNLGKMVTHMGAEVIESNGNLNYSRSLLFQYAIPYYHTGVSASYPFADNFSATAYLYNGWNNVEDNNKQKTFGASLSWTAGSALQLIGNLITGTEQTAIAGSPTHPKNVYEVIANITASDKLTFSADLNYGDERQINDMLAIWKGVALYGRYAFSDITALAIRAENFNDYSGYGTGTVQDMKEVTATFEYKYLTSLLLRLEYRIDFSTVNVYTSAGGTPVNDQNTLTLGAVVTF